MTAVSIRVGGTVEARAGTRCLLQHTALSAGSITANTRHWGFISYFCETKQQSAGFISQSASKKAALGAEPLTQPLLPTAQPYSPRVALSSA